MMLPKTVLRQHLVLLASAGFDPQVIVPSYAGLSAVAKMMPPDTGALLLCGSDMCFRQNGVLKTLRSFSGSQSTGGLRHILQALETEHKEKVEKAALLIDDGAARAVWLKLAWPSNWSYPRSTEEGTGPREPGDSASRRR